MSSLLWRYYLLDDVDKFKLLLATGNNATQHPPKSHGGMGGLFGSLGVSGSPGTPTYGTPPRTNMKTRKTSGHFNTIPGTKAQPSPLTKGDVNGRDQMGLTILHRAASSTGDNAIDFALALIDYPAVDIYLQDLENGWTALHRALYSGNVTIARQLMERDSKDSSGYHGGANVGKINTLIKIKDHEGNSAFDVYNSTIARRTLPSFMVPVEAELTEDEAEESVITDKLSNFNSMEGDELFAFGSNKNLTLGFGDQDDRQYPEKIILKRPDHLLQRLHREHLASKTDVGNSHDKLQSLNGEVSVSEIPTLINSRPIIIQDVALSKLHSAILTTDPEANLYMCGFGPGGRLGTGDNLTRFNYVCIEGGALEGKKIATIALGQNHSIAVSSQGEIFTWGTNTWGVLGYNLPRPAIQDEEPVNNSPRQIFGLLKREIIVGVAASAIHSVAHTSTSLYTWGKNEGQLGLIDSDSGSLEAQTIPRKVGASQINSPILMVSAINRATVCLLANHTVWVFTKYGFNNVKFPLNGGFTNDHLQNKVLTTRYESEPSHISMITSGGDTIAAVSSRGDLFTISVNQKLDTNPTVSSTTNPAKIREALSYPQRIWSLRKGNWDGIRSVDVGENGSVIICTQAGAVWRRVKRQKIKHTFTSGTGAYKAKDYKFQRVPGLTKVVGVRSNIFGAYAAIRKDCDVLKTQVPVDKQSLWDDLAPLLSFRDMVATDGDENEENDTPRFWKPAMPKDLFSNVKRAVLTSPELEDDVMRHIRNSSFSNDEYDFEIGTNLSETTIPAHGFMLAARSSFLRETFYTFRNFGTQAVPELMTISALGNKVKVEFQGLDFITIMNLVYYMYTDEVVDVWNFTRHAPKLAYRYRQIRTELMKLATKLSMAKLESAVRLMIMPERSMVFDFDVAFQDPKFFDDGDVTIELEGDDMTVHSALIRQRCPFFEGLFNGRAGGQWLAARRQDETDTLKVDLKHIEPSIFELVLRYLYSDNATELFDDIIAADIDELSDLIMDVMSVANELMLDRLSQMCQQVIARFANTRNVCQIINSVSPFSVTELKDAGLEYLCLQLEAMLENHLLDDLDEDLLLELDEVVRDNQLACLPFAKSGRAEMLLHERHPSLAGDIDEEHLRMLRDMAFRNSHNDEGRLSSSYRARVGSLEDLISTSPSQDKARRKSKTARNAPFSPLLHSQDPSADLMFDMDDEDVLSSPASPFQRPSDWISPTASGSATPLPSRVGWQDVKGKARDAESPLVSPPQVTAGSLSLERSRAHEDMTSPLAGKPWSAALPSSKLDMRDIMAQTSTGRRSTLSMSLSAQKAKEEAIVKSSSPKMSQRERKKQQQQVLQQAIADPQFTLDKASPNTKSSSPWQTANLGTKTSLKDIFGAKATKSPLAQSQSLGSPIPQLTLNKRRNASPDTRFAGQQRSSSSTSIAKGTTSSPSIIPHSKSYTTPQGNAEPSLQLSMADIIGQQKREQDIIKEAVAKRSLQEIQEEQAFQQWWDQESRRAQEEEALRTVISDAPPSRGKGAKRGRGGSGRGGSRGRGGRGRGQCATVE